jgi:hypothetical protein
VEDDISEADERERREQLRRLLKSLSNKIEADDLLSQVRELQSRTLAILEAAHERRL